LPHPDIAVSEIARNAATRKPKSLVVRIASSFPPAPYAGPIPRAISIARHVEHSVKKIVRDERFSGMMGFLD
jgi:hypothetical protein